MATVVECPECNTKNLVLDGAWPRCSGCDYTDAARIVAAQYVTQILGISKYETKKDGGELPIHTCPAGDTFNTMVDLGASDGEAVTVRFICFDCGETWKDRELMECDGRLGPHWVYPYESAECEACIDEATSRDD